MLIGSLLATGGAATALPALNADATPSTTSATSPESSPKIDNFELIRQMDAVGYESHTSTIDGVIVHFYKNNGMELAVPELSDNTNGMLRIGGGWDWGGPYVRLNRAEQERFLGMGVTAAATAIGCAFVPAAPFAAAIAWAVIDRVQKKGACRGDMRVHFPSAVTCE